MKFLETKLVGVFEIHLGAPIPTIADSLRDLVRKGVRESRLGEQSGAM